MGSGYQPKGGTGGTNPPPGDASLAERLRSPELAAIVDAWFLETFGNVGLDVVAINRFREATERLKRRLAEKE